VRQSAPPRSPAKEAARPPMTETRATRHHVTTSVRAGRRSSSTAAPARQPFRRGCAVAAFFFRMRAGPRRASPSERRVAAGSVSNAFRISSGRRPASRCSGRRPASRCSGRETSSSTTTWPPAGPMSTPPAPPGRSTTTTAEGPVTALDRHGPGAAPPPRRHAPAAAAARPPFRPGTSARQAAAPPLMTLELIAPLCLELRSQSFDEHGEVLIVIRRPSAQRENPDPARRVVDAYISRHGSSR
jgi:hypothetical protein